MAFWKPTLLFDDMVDARLILTDALIDESLGRASAVAPQASPEQNTEPGGSDVTSTDKTRRRGRPTAPGRSPKGPARKGRPRR
jgi:hypothetical protein